MITHNIHCDIHVIPARIGKEMMAAGSRPMERQFQQKGNPCRDVGDTMYNRTVIIIYTGNIIGT